MNDSNSALHIHLNHVRKCILLLIKFANDSGVKSKFGQGASLTKICFVRVHNISFIEYHRLGKRLVLLKRKCWKNEVALLGVA